jgi:hypothetical protein
MLADLLTKIQQWEYRNDLKNMLVHLAQSDTHVLRGRSLGPSLMNVLARVMVFHAS